MGLFQSTFETAAIEYHRAYQSNDDCAKMAAQKLLEKIISESCVDDVTLFLKHINDIADIEPGNTDLSMFTVYDVVYRLRTDVNFCKDFAKALHIDKAALAAMAGMLSSIGKK